MAEANRNPFDFLFKVEFPAYYKILIEQKMIVIVFCLSATLSALALTYVFSEKYLAGTNIYYRPLENSLIREKNSEAFGAPMPTPPFKIIVQTLHDIVKSEPVLRPVVEEFGLNKIINDRYHTWYEQLYQDTKKYAKNYALNLWMILKYGRIIEDDRDISAMENLRKNIDIGSTKDSYVYILSCKDKYPQRAAKIVDSLALHLVDWLRGQDRGPAEKRLHQIRKHVKGMEDSLDDLRDIKNDLLEEKKVVSIKEEISEGVKSFFNMKQELIQLTSQIKNKQGLIAGFDHKIKNIKFGATDPDDLKKLKSEKLFEQINLKGLIAQTDSIKSSLNNMNARLQQLRSLGKAIDSTSMKIEGMQREYSHLRDLDIEALTKATMEESVVKIMHLAETPLKPVQPIKIYHVGLTAILALFVSTALVYVLAFFNIRIFFSSQGLRNREKKSST